MYSRIMVVYDPEKYVQCGKESGKWNYKYQ